MRYGKLAIILVGLLVGGEVWGESPSGQPVAEKNWLEQKGLLVDRFLDRSQTSQRIASQGSSEIKAKIDEIRALRALAASARLAGDTAKAATLLDQALREVTQVSRQAADPSGQEWLHRAHYEDLRDGIHHFDQVYKRHWEQLRQGGSQPKPGYDPEQVRELKEKANILAEKKQYEAANRHLSQAHQMIIAGLKSLLDSKTLVYELKFDTPAQEYSYEQERGSGLESLLRLILAQKSLGEGEKQQVQRLIEQAMGERQQAAIEAAAGDHAVAIKTLEHSNGLFGQALRITGIMMPF